MEDVRVGKETLDSPQERTLYTLQFHLLDENGEFISHTADGNVFLYLEIVPADGGWRIDSVATSP